MEIAMFGAGCFWGVEEAFRVLPGVISTEVGYAGGNKNKGTYQEVCEGGTGHTEVVRIVFDPEKIKYSKLVEVFFSLHDPTQINRQGVDIGYQYRSIIFYFSEEQKKNAEDILKKEQKKQKKTIATLIEKASTYIKAEDYHQKYLLKRGQTSCHI
ncbi:peptide-methionine (S)-S-oxide reductase MsrA [Candidatus Pacearchaeota archaeon]|nr:peptide-methionine (S)-S-oxide reductase MsrA [Candidatus Pacearchaeota archaeon]